MAEMTRREFLGTPPKVLAAAALAGVAKTLGTESTSHPNILLIMVDQMRTPPEGYGPDEGMSQGLKEILGFRPLAPENDYAQYFPGLLRLRQNAVVMRSHHTASAACVPSRACIMTGQYPNVTGVRHTDGLFKSAEEVPWLDPNGVPTVGDWFRAAGYSTHYFGKWHISEVPEASKSLEEWGFAEWEKSWPEPHGGTADNAGAYRDVEFTDRLIEFLGKKKDEPSAGPWFAVGSLLDPHDCSIWPINWQAPANRGVVPWAKFPPPLSIPAEGELSRLGGVYNQHIVKLNPDGFPQENSTLPASYSESLADKPGCQKENAYKWGMAFAANVDYSLQQLGVPAMDPLPFLLQGEDSRDWSLKYLQFYTYCHYLVDLQIRRILQALDESGLTDNTIVVFLSDHGELAGAHGGGIQKWHNAYEETVRVPMVISSPLVNPDKEQMREILQPTSSIDFAPTALGLAGFTASQRNALMAAMPGHTPIPLAGADLSAHIRGDAQGTITGSDGHPRAGVFFMTDDAITATGSDPDQITRDKYDRFNGYVQTAMAAGIPLVPGSIRQPNCVRAFCTGEWKLARYVDPGGVEPDEWELYCLTTDPCEMVNLVDYKSGEVRADVTVPGISFEALRVQKDFLRSELARQEAAVSGVSETREAPASLQLAQNYPNPFNSETVIGFELPVNEPVRLEIINTLGQRVKTLADGQMAAGPHLVRWDGTDANGAKLPSGLYFYRLTAAGLQQTRKLQLVR